ncbi:MAG TPA: TonB family protein [Chthoniobacterales bacterium]|nr:TonB family protein [Chthoniobacterales bacterium]
MPKNLRFWTNVGLIGLAHIAVIYGLIRWSREGKDAAPQTVVWMNGGAGDGIVTEKKNVPLREKSLPRTESKTERARDEDEDRPVLTSAPSEIQLPTPRPSSTVTPKPTPNVKGTPKPKPKTPPRPTPKPTPKPKKATLAKAKPSATSKSEEREEIPGKSEVADAEKKKIVLAKNDAAEAKPAAEKSPTTQTGAGKGTPPGTGGGRVGGSVSQSQFGWYGSMLHDRFYSEWAQPTSVANAGGKNSVLVKLRIEKDGRVSSFEIVRPSGNLELDESVKALANRVSQVDPLPDGLGKGDHYDVKINFELNSE